MFFVKSLLWTPSSSSSSHGVVLQELPQISPSTPPIPFLVRLVETTDFLQFSRFHHSIMSSWFWFDPSWPDFTLLVLLLLAAIFFAYNIASPS
nr:hypothetical protein [Tanacetum cinerariifolium]